MTSSPCLPVTLSFARRLSSRSRNRLGTSCHRPASKRTETIRHPETRNTGSNTNHARTHSVLHRRLHPPSQRDRSHRRDTESWRRKRRNQDENTLWSGQRETPAPLPRTTLYCSSTPPVCETAMPHERAVCSQCGKGLKTRRYLFLSRRWAHRSAPTGQCLSRTTRTFAACTSLPRFIHRTPHQCGRLAGSPMHGCFPVRPASSGMIGTSTGLSESTRCVESMFRHAIPMPACLRQLAAKISACHTPSKIPVREPRHCLKSLCRFSARHSAAKTSPVWFAQRHEKQTRTMSDSQCSGK